MPGAAGVEQAMDRQGKLPRAASGRRGLMAALVALCGAAILAPAAGAETGVTLRKPSDRARWSSTISNQVVPDPTFCASQCPSWTVTVNLPRRSRTHKKRIQARRDLSWPQHDGGLLIGLHWDTAYFDAGYDLDLYVYGPNRQLVAKSASFLFSSDEGAWIQNPPNGTYRVVVVPRSVVGSLPFQIAVGFQRGYTVHESATFQPPAPGFPDNGDFVFPGERPKHIRTLLPDLVAQPATDFHMESAVGGHYYLSPDRGANHQPSCYPQETLGLDNDSPVPNPTGALRCVRFSTVIDNQGDGPYEVRSYQSEPAVYQQIYDSRGAYSERRVARARYYAPHGRMDFQGFLEAGLYTIGADGRPAQLVAKMANWGTCKADTQDSNFGGRRDLPPHYLTPGSCDSYDWTDSASGVHPGQNYVRVGISPGWRDTAPWFLPDQFIDVTSVVPARYLLVMRLNTDSALLESRSANNTSSTCVEIQSTTASACRVP